MVARTQKKFRIELQQEAYRARLSRGAIASGGVSNDVGTQEILDAISALRADLLGGDVATANLTPDTERIIQEKVAVENELKLLSSALDKTKKEIAGLRYSSIHGDRISSMNNQLDEIVMAAEEATNNILESAEEIDSDLQKMQQTASTDDEFMLLEKMSAEVIKIYEACNFQDLTGQRVTKVCETLKHVETRVDAMIKCLGGDDSAFSELVEPEELEDADGVALEGPQTAGEGISQADIDSMFD
ncbi:MAG: hypothetical protein OXR03_21130 [Rhodospirillaceae bacterium]|nr:hypothetical protein [Rhodospirillaceae bacterium]